MKTDKTWVSYKNGNYMVHINLKNGTKVRENGVDFFKADTVESADIKITNFCDRGCSFCFPATTPVLMADLKYKAIETIDAGDKVISFNEASRKFEEQEVVRLYEHITDELIELTLENAAVISCTPNHKFLTQRGWIQAKDLLDSDDITSYNIK